jgi:flagellar hook-associated protein 1 FlgK
MSSLASILSVARTAMQAQQVAMQTTSQNIANANVAGYSVQRVNLAANTPESVTYGQIGTGVNVQSITRSRDILLDEQYRSASTSASGYQATSDMLGRVESVFGEPATAGLSNAMDSLFNSWDDLANDPSDSVARTAVRANGQAVATMFNDFANKLDSLDADNRTELSTNVTQANQLLDKIASLNPVIVGSEAGGRSANDLRDERDRVIDQLSTLMDAHVVERGDGSVAVYSDGRMLVDRDTVHHLVTSGVTSVALTTEGDSEPFTHMGGALGASVDAINTQIPTVRNGLDTLAGSLVREVNAIHSSGQTFSGNPPVAQAAGNFFTQNGAAGTGDVAQTAHGISLDASLSDLSNIAAAGPAATGPGDNTVAAKIAALRDATVTLYDAGGAPAATTTLASYFRQVTTSLGLASSQATDLATAQKTLVTQADSRRQALSGVATDEELVQLIKQQQAYAAAARIISAVDDMSKTLLAIT